MPPGLERYIRYVFSDDSGFSYEIDQAFDSSFNVEKSRKRDPDTANIQIFNLKKDVRAFLGAAATTVEAYASRMPPAALIFKGEIIDAVSNRGGNYTDWLTTVDSEDTKSKLRTRVIGRTYDAGTSSHVAFRDLAAAAELQVSIVAADTSLVTPMSFLGVPRDCIGTLAKRLGLRYQIINGIMIITDGDAPIIGKVPLISSATGLIGVPTVKREKRVVKVTFQTMLDAALVPGGLCKLQTTAIESGRTAQLNSTNDYWIDRVTHSGANKGDFYTEVECEAV